MNASKGVPRPGRPSEKRKICLKVGSPFRFYFLGDVKQ
jgi:hypothetical protein